MKKSLVIIFFLTSLFGFSQSSDLDPFEFNYSYVKLPNKPILEKQNRTYSFLISIDKSLLYSKSKYFFENQINISGLEKKQKNGYMSIEISLQNPTITKKDIVTRTSIEKDKNGTQRTKYYYTPVVSYSQQGNAKTVSADGKINKIISFNGNNSLKGSESENYNLARSTQYSLGNSLVNNYLNEVVSRLNNELNDEYGYVIKQGKDQLWILANKKHAEQQVEYDNYIKVKNAFQSMSFSESISKIEADLKEAIEYFESLPSKYNQDVKNDKKIRYSAFYNLSKIYAYLDYPEKSIEWSKKLVDNDYDSNDGKTMIKENENVINLFNVNKLQTRHFPVETKNYVFEEEQSQPIYVNNSSQVQSAPYSLETDPNYMLAYILTIRKDTITGYLYKSRAMNLGDNIIVTVKDFQGKFSERSFKANEVNRLILSNGEEYASVAFKVSVDNGGMTLAGATRKFAKEMFVGKKISVYQYFNGEIIVKSAKDSEGKSTASASWMLVPKKRFEELATGCLPLLERVDKREFKNNLESIMSFAQALEDY